MGGGKSSSDISFSVLWHPDVMPDAPDPTPQYHGKYHKYSQQWCPPTEKRDNDQDPGKERDIYVTFSLCHLRNSPLHSFLSEYFSWQLKPGLGCVRARVLLLVTYTIIYFYLRRYTKGKSTIIKLTFDGCLGIMICEFLPYFCWQMERW